MQRSAWGSEYRYSTVFQSRLRLDLRTTTPSFITFRIGWLHSLLELTQSSERQTRCRDGTSRRSVVRKYTYTVWIIEDAIDEYRMPL